MNPDVVSLIYKELFTVKFLHDGYGSARQRFISSAIRLQPDEDTKTFFVNYNLGYRFFTDSLICFIRSSLLNPPAKEPKIPFVRFADKRIRFYLLVTDDFINNTDVVSAGAKQVYQFSNRQNIGTGGFISQHEEGVNNEDLTDRSATDLHETTFGVIDIYDNGAVNNTYNLFDTGQQLLSPHYNIRFVSKI